MSASKPDLKQLLKGPLQAKEKFIQREILSEETSDFRDEERAGEMLNIQVNIIDYSPLEFFKIQLMIEIKTLNIAYKVFTKFGCNIEDY